MPIQIRPIQPFDIPACCRIYNTYIRDTTCTFEEEPLTETQFSDRVARIRREYPYLVAEQAGQVLGYAYFDRFNTRSAYRYTVDLSIYLSRESCHLGIGEHLLEELEIAGRQAGFRQVISLVTDENEASLRFHRRHGFSQAGHLPEVGEKFGRKIGIFFFQKAL